MGSAHLIRSVLYSLLYLLAKEEIGDTIKVKGRGGVAGVDDDEYGPMPDEERIRGVDG